jgi:hypothetical protein
MKQKIVMDVFNQGEMVYVLPDRGRTSISDVSKNKG